MKQLDSYFIELQNATVRKPKCKVELLDESGSTLLGTFTQNDRLISTDIYRQGDSSKFFGYGMTTKVNVKLANLDNTIQIHARQVLRISFAFDDSGFTAFPLCVITEVYRDEDSNELSITAYDMIYKANEKVKANYFDDSIEYSFRDACIVIANAIKIGEGITEPRFVNLDLVELSFLDYTSKIFAKVKPETTLRTLINYICESIGAIAYIDGNNTLTFKGITHNETSAGLILPERYSKFTTNDNRRLAILDIVNDSDEHFERASFMGSTQYILNNPLINNGIGSRDSGDLASTVLGLNIYQFNINWFVDFSYDFGDKITIQAVDGSAYNTYLFDDIISYDGGLTGKSSFRFEKEEVEIPMKTITEALEITPDIEDIEDIVGGEVEIVVDEIIGDKLDYIDEDGNYFGDYFNEEGGNSISIEDGEFTSTGNDSELTIKDGVLRSENDEEDYSLYIQDGALVSEGNENDLIIADGSIEFYDEDGGEFLGDLSLEENDGDTLLEIDFNKEEVDGVAIGTETPQGALDCIAKVTANEDGTGGKLWVYGSDEEGIYYKRIINGTENGLAIFGSYFDNKQPYQKVVSGTFLGYKDYLTNDEGRLCFTYNSAEDGEKGVKIWGRQNGEDSQCLQLGKETTIFHGTTFRFNKSGYLDGDGQKNYMQLYFVDRKAENIRQTTFEFFPNNKIVVIDNENTNAFQVFPSVWAIKNYESYLGTYNARWKYGYFDNVYSNSAPVVTSDKNDKNSIEDIKPNEEKFFDSLRPVSYKLNDGSRKHYGFIAQEVEEGLEANQLSCDEVGIVCKSKLVDGEFVNDTDFAGVPEDELKYSLRYEELIALCVDKIQKLEKRVEELERVVNEK